MGLGHFFKWPPWKSNMGDIPTSKWHRIIFLLSTPKFSGAKNWIKPKIGHSYGEFEKIQDGNWWKSFYDKIWIFILQTKFVDMLKC